ncbi:MAG TPA: ABC transporter ATP-binding protein [Xanthobacteraceae bacterium]|jgi:ATP-binding cassette subfamily B protein|nr:ABC transporter ATP-binding protein [Xanthobacteraceae bacterium]
MLSSRLRSLFADPESTLAMIRRLLLEHAAGRWKRYGLAFALMAVTSACTAIVAYLVKDFVNETYIGKNFLAIVAVGLATMVLYMLKGASTYGHTVVLARINSRIIADIQQRTFDKLLNQGLGYFADRHSSDFIARLTAGTTAVTQVLNLLILAIGRDLLTLIGLAVVMAIQDPVLLGIGLIGVPPAMLVLRKLIRRIRVIAHNQFTGGARILETMQEMLQGIRIVKSFTLEEQMRARFAASVAEVEGAANKMARVVNRASPLMESIAGVGLALAVIYSGYRVINTSATAGELMSFLAAFVFAFEPAKRLARLNIDLNANLIGARVLYELIDAPPSEPIADDGPPLVLSPAVRIEFSGVRFAYRRDEPVIRGMSFVAEPGKVTALVGPSGGGKSTVLNLLLRFYDAESGTITIDERDISHLPRRALRRQIGYVGQHVHLFRGSIRENIAFGKPRASETEIVAAAHAAHAHEFIVGFPAGYATEVGEHGLLLSGGQRQRVAIARALIKDAPIILLDEATAALDSESERQVQDAMARLCEGRTTVVVAHRLATIMHADRILVVEQGAVVETGRHEELLRKGGRYASFYRAQLKDQAPPREPVVMASSG